MKTRTLGLAFALALVIPGGSASAQCTKTVLECIEDMWNDVVDWDGTNPQDSVHWSEKIASVNWDLDSNAECADVKAVAVSIFSTATWYTGEPKGNYNGTWVAGGNGKADGIILNGWYMLEDYDDNLKLALILHEAAHAAGKDHPEGEGVSWWPEACG